MLVIMTKMMHIIVRGNTKMKIIVTACGSEANAKIDERFGRAAYFMLYDQETQTWKSFNNKQNLDTAKGAGIQAAQNVQELDADILITGNVGPKAFRVLEAAGIQIFSARNTTVEKALQDYLGKNLLQLKSASREGHWI